MWWGPGQLGLQSEVLSQWTNKTGHTKRGWNIVNENITRCLNWWFTLYPLHFAMKEKRFLCLVAISEESSRVLGEEWVSKECSCLWNSHSHMWDDILLRALWNKYLGLMLSYHLNWWHTHFVKFLALWFSLDCLCLHVFLFLTKVWVFDGQWQLFWNLQEVKHCTILRRCFDSFLWLSVSEGFPFIQYNSCQQFQSTVIGNPIVFYLCYY